VVIYPQWLSVLAKLKGKISIVKGGITAVDSTMMIGTDQDYVLYVILPTPAQPMDVMAVTERFPISSPRVPETNLTLALIPLLEFLYKLFVPRRSLLEQVCTPLPCDSVLLFTNETFYRFLVA